MTLAVPPAPRCPCGRLTTDDLDTCGHYECELHARGAGPLELARDDGGWRHFLQGEPVRCGAGLLLAAVRADEQPPRAPEQWTRVRYESSLATSSGEPPALLYADVGGHDAVIRAHGGMRLRWPHRREWR